MSSSFFENESVSSLNMLITTIVWSSDRSPKSTSGGGPVVSLRHCCKTGTGCFSCCSPSFVWRTGSSVLSTSSLIFTSSGVTDLTCWSFPNTVLFLKMISCSVLFVTRMATCDEVPPLSVMSVSGTSRPGGQGDSTSGSNNTGNLDSVGSTFAEQVTTTVSFFGTTMSLFVTFTLHSSLGVVVLMSFFLWVESKLQHSLVLHSENSSKGR